MSEYKYSSQAYKLYITHTISPYPLNRKTSENIHDICELYYFISGDAYFIVEGCKYPLKPGSLLFFRDGETHCFHCTGPQQYERITLMFSASDICSPNDGLYSFIYDRPLGHSNLLCNVFQEGEANNDMLVHNLLTYLCNKNLHSLGIDYDRCLLDSIRIILSHAASRANTTDLSSNIAVMQEKTRNYTLVKDIITYINSNLVNIEGLTEFEEKFFFSRSYLNSIFKSAIGSTIWEYIIITMAQTTPPRNRLPVSPMKTLAGCQL